MTRPDDAPPDERLDAQTTEAEARDAAAPHDPDRMPTPEEEAAAPGHVDDEVGEHYREMARKGAEAQGEGRIDGD